MAEKDPDNDQTFYWPKIDFEKKSFRKLRTCTNCNRIIIAREELVFFEDDLWVFVTCPWCKGFIYKRKKEDGDEWLALSN